MPKSTKPRTGQARPQLTRKEFHERFQRNFYDPLFEKEKDAIRRVEVIAWTAYDKDRKAPLTAKAGPGFADPKYELSVEWRATHDKLVAAEKKQKNSRTRSRVLVVCGSSRNDGTCPGEMSKTFRLSKLVSEVLEEASVEVDLLDLSRLTSEYALKIHPCKSCVSSAMPLCHWPCSCYPNHAFNQVNDWMAEIYEKWVAAHGVILLTPVNWYHTASGMKLMIDRLVCADGGNPDPTLTGGKDVVKAKQVELDGWSYPKHLEGRVYGLVVHGDVAGIEETRYALSDWLDWMGLVDAGHLSRLDRFIGYYKPYATSHAELDGDKAVQEEVRNVARAVAHAVREMRAGKLSRPDASLKPPRPK
ncbi:MAG: flavodoxin family protein [Pseudomonadota bacterium]|nr:flavodoxin family protein [Pseudomonadota bacterium]